MDLLRTIRGLCSKSDKSAPRSAQQRPPQNVRFSEEGRILASSAMPGQNPLQETESSLIRFWFFDSFDQRTASFVFSNLITVPSDGNLGSMEVARTAHHEKPPGAGESAVVRDAIRSMLIKAGQIFRFWRTRTEQKTEKDRALDGSLDWSGLVH